MIKNEIVETISQFIEEQFPAIYREEGQVLIDFLIAYYEYVESNGYMINRDMFTIRDIDTTYDSFVNEFRKKYIEDMPFITATDTRFLIKNIMDLYRSKGSEESVKLLMRMLFNTEVDIYYPSTDILRLSDSEWTTPTYIEVSSSPRTKDFLNKKIVGSESSATGVVENIVTKRINNKIVDIVYLVDVGGDFKTGEYISDNGRTKGAPKIIGSLSDIEVELGGSGYAVGDTLDVISPDGVNGVATITEVLSTTDSVQFNFTDGGFGYTLDENTEVLVSTAMLFCDNSDLSFNNFDVVTQKLEKLTLISSNTNIEIGDNVVGYNSSNTEISSGDVVAVGEDNITIETKTGSFARVFSLELQEENRFFPNETVNEENVLEIQFDGADGSFINGERIIQRTVQNGISTDVAIGTVELVDASIIYLNSSFGTFNVGSEIHGLTSDTTATITSVVITSEGNSGLIVESSNNSISVLPLSGDFSSNTKIRGERSYNINLVNQVSASGLDYVKVGNTSIVEVENYNDVSASGIVVGQNEERVGLYGNTNPFFFVNEIDNFISDGTTTKLLTRVGFGSGATFEVTSLLPDTEETFTYNSDIIGSENLAGASYLNINIADAVGSNASRVANNVNILSGGSGYSNTSVVSFSGGGYLGGEPLITAVAEAVVGANGEIEEINVIDGGQGYFETPIISITEGSGANVEVSLEIGYGFPNAPYNGYTDILSETWTTEEVTLGEIFSIGKINNGSKYDAGVFTKVVNSRIQNFNLYDILVSLTDLFGTFAEGEVLNTNNGFKARVKAVDTDNNTVILKSLSFINQLSIGDNLVGETSLSSANVESIEILENSSPAGENAVVDSLVILADGVIAKVKVKDSGYGYTDDSVVELTNKTTGELATTGIAKLRKQGISPGFWRTTSSHLNDKRLRDNYFYQEYSYQIIASLSFDKYENIIRDILHVAGTEMFGAVERKLNAVEIYNNTIEISRGGLSTIPDQLIGSFNIANTSFVDINLNPPFNSGVGRINTIATVINGGVGYSNNSVMEIIGGGGEDGNSNPTENAEGYVVTDDSGSIQFVVITDSGSGYTAVPTVSISEGTGANIQLSVEYGYGFAPNPYSSFNSVIGNVFGGDTVVFIETDLIYETQT